MHQTEKFLRRGILGIRCQNRVSIQSLILVVSGNLK